MGTARDKALKEVLDDVFSEGKPDKEMSKKIRNFTMVNRLRVGFIIVTFLYVYWWFLYG